MVKKQSLFETMFPYIAGLCTILVTVVLIWEVTRLGVMVYADKTTLAQTAYDLARLDALLGDEKANAPAILSITESLPNDYRNVSKALSAIESLAKNHALIMEVTIDDKAKDKNGAKGIHVTLTLDGNYANVQAFLTDVSRLPYHTLLEELSADNKSGSGVHASVGITLFIQ